MSINSEREVTNKSFKAKMSEIISVLSGETYTPVPAANDSETLNCKTFEYFMNVLKENVGGGGGSSLPAVTSDDNGDVLQVIEGAWAKGPAPATDNDFIISATLTFDGSPVLSSQTTISDIIAANTAGKNIKLEITSSGMGVFFGTIIYLVGADGDDPEAGFMIYMKNFGKVVCNKTGWAIGS